MQVFSALTCLFLSALVQAQQYAGTAITTTTPATAGAEIAFFRIADGNGGFTTHVNYFSKPTSTGQRPDPLGIQRLVILLSGTNRDGWNYFAHARTALLAAQKINPNVNDTSVALLAPWFANDADLPSGNGNTLVWKGVGWYKAENNIFPAAQKTVSSYDVLDQILQYYGNLSIFPNMKQIVVAGHSRGAQTAVRYATIGKQLGLAVPVTYFIANPSAFAWLSTNRPVAPGTCTTYDVWEGGLTNYTLPYNNAFVQNRAAVVAQYTARSIGYARGLNDFGKSDDDCKPTSQGANRGERFYNFLTEFPPDIGDTVDYVAGAGHSDTAMFNDISGQYRLFLDNFDGLGHKKADFGARQIAVDNPHPIDT
ncbi:hypothetical protein DL96DRAFT_1616996 [Flagelloscypha sp. PMI_526]|nr:hypothetical protein DL96DRAFT_1616996 [Flagelloscypha sp. PMI_526]